MITDIISINKIAKSLELICPLYKENLITEAYIVGSVAKGIAREDSDTDIDIINPDFNLVRSPPPSEGGIIEKLQNIGK